MRETAGAVAVAPRSSQHDYFGQSAAVKRWCSTGPSVRESRLLPPRWDAPIFGAAGDERGALLRELREHYGSRWPRMRDGIERAGETVEKLGFAISAGEWHDDIHAVGVGLKLNDGTGPYALIAAHPHSASRKDRLRNDIWTSPRGDGKEHRSGLGRHNAAIKKRNKAKS